MELAGRHCGRRLLVCVELALVVAVRRNREGCAVVAAHLEVSVALVVSLVRVGGDGLCVRRPRLDVVRLLVGCARGTLVGGNVVGRGRLELAHGDGVARARHTAVLRLLVVVVGPAFAVALTAALAFDLGCNPRRVATLVLCDVLLVQHGGVLRLVVRRLVPEPRVLLELVPLAGLPACSLGLKQHTRVLVFARRPGDHFPVLVARAQTVVRGHDGRHHQGHLHGVDVDDVACLKLQQVTRAGLVRGLLAGARLQASLRKHDVHLLRLLALENALPDHAVAGRDLHNVADHVGPQPQHAFGVAGVAGGDNLAILLVLFCGAHLHDSCLWLSRASTRCRRSWPQNGRIETMCWLRAVSTKAG
eukprot:Rhum_TRINITY_DN14631_c11_g1::Rhum_TRINITY_DN14631_c11_g1_i1::g.105097::m.105097